MKGEEQLREKYGNDTGYRVPDDYFRDLQTRVMDSLPPYKTAPREKALTPWERVKPYVYLAAMFCGIWLMMKVFHNVSDPGTLSLDNPPDALVMMMETDSWEQFWDDIYEPEFILEEEVCGNYDNMEDFEKDFNYTLKPEYSNYVITLENATI